MYLHSVICLIPFYFDIQHDPVLKKLKFDFFYPPPPRFGEGVGLFFICFKHDFHVNAGRMIVKTREI